MLNIHFYHFAERKFALLIVSNAQIPVLVDLPDHLQYVARLQTEFVTVLGGEVGDRLHDEILFVIGGHFADYPLVDLSV